MAKSLKEKVSSMKKRNRYKYHSIKNLFNNEKRYWAHSTSLLDAEDPKELRRAIIIGAHVLEKGLSHSDFRPGFGKESVCQMQRSIVKYMNSNDLDLFALNNAVSLLFKYHEKNSMHGFDDSQYLDLSPFAGFASTEIHPIEITVEATDDASVFRKIAEQRHSVRCYEEDGLPIAEETLKDVIELANTAPSACNRQATRVYAVTDRKKFKAIENMQLGCKGFGEHASLFLFVASDLSMYSRNEEKLPVFDAGLYTMNLLYALQAYGLYACTLNASFPGQASRQIHELTAIPDAYDINGLIAVYRLDQGTVVKVPASPRRSADEVLEILHD